MVYRVVSTKLTEEEHSSMMDKCNKQGCSPSLFIKTAILERIKSHDKGEENDLEGSSAKLEPIDEETKETHSKPVNSNAKPVPEIVKFMRLLAAQKKAREASDAANNDKRE